MFNYFIPIKIMDIIALPLHVALHATLCLQPYWLSLHSVVPSQCPPLNKSHILCPSPEPGWRSPGAP